MAFKQLIENTGAMDGEIVVKYTGGKGGVIKRGSLLTVRQGQAAVFADRGRIADVFEAGQYKLETDSLPLLSKLQGWKFGFKDTATAELYFVNTLQQLNRKWGTPNPVLLTHPDYGAVRVRAFGSYSFRPADAARFLTEVSGAGASFSTDGVTDYIRGMIAGGVSEALGESKLKPEQMAANLSLLSDTVSALLTRRFTELGLELTDFRFESLSLPPELEKAVDESVKLSMLAKNIDVYAAKAKADAAVESAKHAPAVQVVQAAGAAVAAAEDAKPSKRKFCGECGAPVTPTAKFCTECGAKL